MLKRNTTYKHKPFYNCKCKFRKADHILETNSCILHLCIVCYQQIEAQGAKTFLRTSVIKVEK